jgi:hypothetical protein
MSDFGFTVVHELEDSERLSNLGQGRIRRSSLGAGSM